MKRIVFLFLLGFQTICYGDYSTYIKTDKFTPDITTLEGESIRLSSFFNARIVNVTPKYIFGKDTSTFVLSIQTFGDDWIFINEIILLINNHPVSIKMSSRPFRDTDALLGKTEEIIDFEISKTLFDKIVKEKTVPLRLNGDKYYIEKEFNTETINNLTNFYETAVVYEKCRIDSTNCAKDKAGIPYFMSILSNNDALNSSGMAGLTVTNMDTISKDDIARHNLSNGVLVVDVVKGSIAEKAGLKSGDIIEKFGFFQTVKTKEEVKAIIDEIKHGDSLIATVFHKEDGIFATVLSLYF